jgi:hypothetical protein
MTALSSLRQIIHVETLADLTAELGCAPGYMAWVDGYGRYTAIPVDTYSVDNLHVVEGYAADNIQWADESIIGAGGFTNIIHEPCLYLATRSIDVTSPDGYGIDCDTIYSLSDGNRILLTKQSSARENGPWVWKGIDLPLERPEDWAGGSIITVDTIHQFTVLYGTLWGGTTTWFGYFGASDILIWGPGMSSGQSVNWFHVGGGVDVIDTVVAIDEEFSYTPPGADADHRYSVRLSGVVEMLDDYTAGIFAGTSKSIPLDVDPGMGYNSFTDDLGETWTLYGSSSVAYRDTTTKYQGTSSWRIETPSSAGTPYTTGLTKIFALPSGQVGRFTAKVLRSSDWSEGYMYAQLGVDTGLFDTVEHEYPSELGSKYIASTSTWTSVVFDIPATNTTRMLKFSLFGFNHITSTATRKVGWIDAVQIAKTVSSDFATRVIVDAEYGPGSLVNAIYYADDTQGRQVIDADAQLGGTMLCLFDMSGSNVITLNTLSIARSVRLTVGLFPAAPSASAPALPETPTLPAYPY